MASWAFPVNSLDNYLYNYKYIKHIILTMTWDFRHVLTVLTDSQKMSVLMNIRLHNQYFPVLQCVRQHLRAPQLWPLMPNFQILVQWSLLTHSQQR